VLTRPQAGLFSAVTSAFIIEVHSHLQQDPNDVTAALLRVLLYKIDNTTFGNDVPILPQWTGPPRTIVHVQAILLASLAASLLSAFLAMLGKQWLNRYASTEVRGTAIERSQYRQRKFDGIVTWYFDHVMEALPLMLQVALLLLGCALSRYLWEINVTVASVVLAVTSFGMIFYIFVVVAGAASAVCPYQTPGARILRHISHQISHHILLPALRSAPSVISRLSTFISSWFSYFISPRFSHFTEASLCRLLTVKWWSSLQQPWHSMFNVAISLFCTLAVFPIALVADACLLGGVLSLLFVDLGKIVCGWLLAASVVAMRYLPVFGRTAYHQFVRTFSAQTPGLDQQTIALDLRCISWMLQMSLDKAVHLSALKHLATITRLGNFDPTLVFGCFDVFIDCIKVDVDNSKAVVMQGLEELAAVSAMCFLRTFHHLSVIKPTSPVLEDICQRYTKVFSFQTDPRWRLPFDYTMTKIDGLAGRFQDLCPAQWDEWRPPTQEWILYARGIAEIAQAKFQQTPHRKAPRWTLHFTLDSLALEPLPPASIVADCLSVIAIDLGCDVPNTGFAVSDERSVSISQMSITLTLNQCTSGASCEADSWESHRDALQWKFRSTPIQVQGNHRASSIRDPAGARRTT
jgi:ribosome modulation factor